MSQNHTYLETVSSYQTVRLFSEQMEISDDDSDVLREPCEKQLDDAVRQLLSYFESIPRRQIATEISSVNASLEPERISNQQLSSPPRRFYRSFWKGLVRRKMNQQVACVAEQMCS